MEALKMAIQQWKPKQGLIHHSDRGVEYPSNLKCTGSGKNIM